MVSHVLISGQSDVTHTVHQNNFFSHKCSL